MKIREAGRQDLEKVYQMFRDIIEQEVYFPYDTSTPKEHIEQSWVNPKHLIYVAEEDGAIAGAYIVKPNQPGHGAHVANAAYMVDAAFRNRGIGRELAAHSLEAAKAAGFRAMQYNLVVSTNKSAVHLWQSLGFEIIGVIPEGFHHVEKGYVDAFIFYRKLV